MKVNRGYFFGNTYYKQVKFSKAVLWKDKQLSLPVDIMNRILTTGIKKMVFKDPTKNEAWIFNPEKVKPLMIRKLVGQEVQFYFPIELAVKKPLPLEEEYKIS